MADEAGAVGAVAEDFIDVPTEELSDPSLPAPRVTTPSRLTTMERHRKAFELRMAGATYQQIADALQYKSAAGAHGAVKGYIDRMPREEMKDARQLQIARVNEMILRIRPMVQAGDLAAINTQLRLMDKLDRYLGTEEPEKITVEHAGVVVVEGDEEKYIEALKMMAAQQNPPAQDIEDAIVIEDDEDELLELEASTDAIVQSEEHSAPVVDLGV